MKLNHLSLRWKIFSGLFCISVLLSVVLYLFLRFLFVSDFSRYIEQKDVARCKNLIDSLQKDLLNQNIQSLFDGDEARWLNYVIQHAKAPGSHPNASVVSSRDRENLPLGPGVQDRRVPPFFEMTLYDGERNRLVGRENHGMKIHYEPIFRQRLIVGYLGIPLNPALTGVLENEFIGDYTGTLMMVCVFSLLTALLVSIPVSALLSRRFQALAGRLREMEKGNFSSFSRPLESQDEFTILELGIWELSKSLREAESARRELVANISHDLRTPLAVLKADLEALQDGVRQWGPESLNRLIKHNDRLHALVNDLYELSLTQLGNLQYRKEILDLNNLVRLCVDEFQNVAQQSGLQLHISTTSTQDTALIYADSARIEQLLGNLLSNSLKYTHSPGSISVEVSADQQYVYFSVADSGPSLPDGDFDKIFHRAYRGSLGQTSSGSGLGLNICKNIVEAHGGNIHAQKSPEGGVTIQVQFPRIGYQLEKLRV